MPEEYGFDYELPSGQACYVEAEVWPLVPAHTNCLPEDAYPSEGGYAEVVGIHVRGVEIDMGEVWVRSIGKKYVYYLDDLGETAYEKWSNEQ